MAEQSGFFNANLVNGEYDRVYLAEHFAKYFASFIGNGVFGGKSDELMVTQTENSTMMVELLTGMGWINGYWYENTSSLSLSVTTADGVLNRIDNVVLRFEKAERRIKAVIVRGTPASNAVAPAVQRNADYYELKLAEINVRAGTTGITQAQIKDTRLNSEVCGFVTGILQQFDTTEFGKQLDGYISDFAAQYRNYLQELELNSSTELVSVFDRLNALIEDESALGTLTVELANVESEAAIMNQTLGYTKKNLIPYPFFEMHSKVTNGITWTNNNNGTITINGTATGESNVFLYRGENFLVPGLYYITSGAYTESTRCFIRCIFINKEDGAVVREIARDYNNTPFEITASDIENYNFVVAISVVKGAVISNITFKPMIRKAGIIDAAWEPYRLSVAEMIQEDKTEKGCFFRMNRFTGIKEWLNAPNVPGIEYCLTERWNGNPVYQKTIFAAALPNNTVMTVYVNAYFDEIISITGFAIDSDNNMHYEFPIILNGLTPAAVISFAEGDGGAGSDITINTNDDLTSFKAYITVKYTKKVRE